MLLQSHSDSKDLRKFVCSGVAQGPDWTTKCHCSLTCNGEHHEGDCADEHSCSWRVQPRNSCSDLKSWLNIPSRGVTDLTFFHPSQLYFEGHAGNYVNSCLKGDKVVNVALDSALEREKEWSRKSSTIAKCDEIFKSPRPITFQMSPTVSMLPALSLLRSPRLRKL